MDATLEKLMKIVNKDSVTVGYEGVPIIMIRCIFRIHWCVGFSLFCLSRVWAAEGRPVESIAFEEIMPDEVGSWDLRLSMEARRSQPEDGKVMKPSIYSIPRVQFFFGILEGLGGELGVPLLLRKQKKEPATEGDEAPVEAVEGEGSHFGIGDVSMGLKYLFLKEREYAPALVAMFELGLPTGDKKKGLGEDKTEFDASLGWVKTFPAFIAQGTMGYLTTNKEVERKFEYNFSLAVPVGESWHLFSEMLGERDLKSNTNRLSLGPGLKYNISPEMFLAIGAPIGLTKKADDYRVITQVQYGF